MTGRAIYLASGKRVRISVLAFALGTAASLLGCVEQPKPTPGAQPYVDQGYKAGVPNFMHGTVFERADVANIDPYPVTGYSLVVNLHETGDNSGIPTSVRTAMIKRMALAGFGQHDDPSLRTLQPEDMLRDKRVAIVQVIGMMPAGVRRGQQFDLIVRSMPRSHTTSLAHGHLYNADLAVRGLELPDGAGEVMAYADAGDLMIAPSLALDAASRSAADVAAPDLSSQLCTAAVMNGGRAAQDRPIFLQLRVPQASIARTIENRVNTRYQSLPNDRHAANAQDEALIDLFVPYSFNGDWRHFVAVVNHLYLADTPQFVNDKVKSLVAAAHAPGAPLSDISYCLEGFGPGAVPLYAELMDDPDPAVAFAGARAAAFCSNTDAIDVLGRLADNTAFPQQLAAVQTLSELPTSPAVDRYLEPLLASSKTDLRIAAYKILASHQNRRIITATLPGHFTMDLVDWDGPPMVYATRTGDERIVIFGRKVMVGTPLVFSAMQNQFTISSNDAGDSLTLFYRENRRDQPIRVESRPILAEVIARLGGSAPEKEDHLQFSYPDVVAIISGLAEAHALTVADSSGNIAAADFVLEQPQQLTDALAAAGLDGRPQGTAAPAAGPSAPGVTGQPMLGTPTPTGEVPSFSSPNPAPASGSGNSDPSHSVPTFGNP